MTLSKRIAALLTAGALAAFAAGCGKASDTASNTNDTDKKVESTPITLNISAAASLKDSMEEIKQLYTKDKSNVTLTYNFGSSGTLQQQIEQGADVDLFMSAAAKQMDDLQSKNLIDKDSRKDLLENNIVLVTPKDNPVVKDFSDLTTDKVKKIALGEPKSVPAGQYAEEVFTKMSILDKVKGKAVYGNDVKAVLTWVESGNAEAGIVYETDAKISTKVQIAATAPADSHKAVVYPAAVVKSSKKADAAKEFLKFLSGDKAKKVFEKYGFKVN